MHDPQTLAFSIKSPFKNSKGERPTLIDIWHVDPETDGSDDSCAWFIRSRHLDSQMMEKIRKDIDFEYQYWFNEQGFPNFSVIGTAFMMYRQVCWSMFGHLYGSEKRHVCTVQFMKKYTHEIISFAENPHDSLHSSIMQVYGRESKDERVRHFASIIAADIARKLRPWYKHPRWHIHHWKINFVWWRTNVVRRFWTKCSVCGRRGGFMKGGVVDWSGKNLRHMECDLNSRIKETPSHDAPNH